MRYLIKIRRIWRIYGLFGAFQELAIRRSCWLVESAGPGAHKSKANTSDATIHNYNRIATKNKFLPTRCSNPSLSNTLETGKRISS